MHSTTLAAFLVAFAAGASAHMEVVDPPVFRGKTNTLATNVDFNMVAPLDEGGSNFPCKGYHSDFGTPAGGSTKTYTAGQQASFKTAGVEAAHNGGSCQVSLSYDQGKTWKVIKSFIGNCVRSAGGNVFDANQEYSFTIPAEAKSGDALWAWTWFNQTGNREMYMNCAHITIQGSGTSTLDDHPDRFVANVNKGCTTKESNDVEFPNPGKDVERNPAKNGATTAPPVCTGGTGAPVPAPAPAPGAGAPPAPGKDAPAPPAGGRTHTVAAGEFCASIAQANGMTVAALLAANPTVDPACTTLKVGQTLNLRRRSRVMRAIA
jgi:LysM repeat protein